MLFQLVSIPSASIALWVYPQQTAPASTCNAPAVANVGTRPTVNDSIRANLEVHVLEGSPNLYGERIEVTFCHKMRDEVKYDSLDALKAGIAQDIRNTAQWFARRGH